MDERKRFLRDFAVGAIYAYWRQRQVGYSQVKVIERTLEVHEQNDGPLFPNSLVFVLKST